MNDTDNVKIVNEEENIVNVDSEQEDVTKYKKKSPLIKVAIAFAIVCTGIIVGYFSYQALLGNKTTPKDDTTQKETNNKKDKEKDDNNEEALDIVIDANYKAPTEVRESYDFDHEGNTVKLSDLVVPYINIDTDAVKEINKNIQEFYNDLVEQYDTYSKEVTDDQPYSHNYIKSSYEYYEIHDLLSIVIKINTTGRGSSEAEEYFTINYDMQTEKMLTLKDLCDKVDIKYEDVIKQTEKAIDETIKKTYEITDNEHDEEINEYNKNNKEYFTMQKNSSSEIAYVDKDANLIVITNIEHPFGGCGYYFDFVKITK